jgi:hypothetical protein
VLRKHLRERIHQICISFLYGFNRSSPVELPPPQTSFPFTSGKHLHTTEDWAVFRLVGACQRL